LIKSSGSFDKEGRIFWQVSRTGLLPDLYP